MQPANFLALSDGMIKASPHSRNHLMRISRPVTLFTVALLLLFMLPAHADDEAAKDNDLIEVVASHDLSVRRGTDSAVKEGGIHPKKISNKKKHELDRFAIIRFDSEDFGKRVRAVGLKLTPVNFGDYNKSMRFRVYGVYDGDKQDEKFTEKDYDPNAEDTIVDRRISNVLDRKQIAILGTFSTEKDEPVLFTSKSLLSLVRTDTNGTVTLVLVRTTDSGQNSTFARRQTETPPTLVMKVNEKEEQSEETELAEDQEGEPEADAEPTE
jgi:hypothetical protein